MNQLLLLQQFISNEKIDIDIFDLLVKSKNASITEFYDLSLVQKFYPLLNGVSQSFFMNAIHSIVENYTHDESNKKEKITNNTIYIDLLGIALLKKTLLNFNQLNNGVVSDIKQNIDEHIQTLLPFYKNSDSHLQILRKKHPINLNILEMGYLFNDEDIVNLGLKLNQSISEKNIGLLLKNFIYYDNKKGLTYFKEQKLIDKFFNSKTLEQQFLFILEAVVPLNLSSVRYPKEEVNKYFNQMNDVFDFFNLPPLDNPIMPISLYEHMAKLNTSSRCFQTPSIIHNIDAFLDKHMLNKCYPDSIIIKMASTKEGMQFVKEKGIYLSKDINSLLDSKFLQSERLYEHFIWEIAFQLVDIHHSQSFDCFKNINQTNFKKLICHLDSKTPVIKDEYFSVLLKEMILDLDTVFDSHDIPISGVSKKMSLGHMAGVAFMNRGFINSFETLISKGIALENIDGAKLSLVDVIANRKKTGTVYATIVEKYKLTALIDSNDNSIKKRVKI